MTGEEKELVKQWCHACEREYGEKCWQCPLYGLVRGIGKHYENGWTMAEAMRAYMRMSPTPEVARKLMEETLDMPLDVAKMIIREIRDYEECHDV